MGSVPGKSLLQLASSGSVLEPVPELVSELVPVAVESASVLDPVAVESVSVLDPVAVDSVSVLDAVDEFVSKSSDSSEDTGVALIGLILVGLRPPVC
jgi:hypothetical protein